MNYKATKKAYDEILTLVKSHKDVCSFDISEMENKAKNHLYRINLEEKYGIGLSTYEICTPDYTKIDKNRYIAMHGKNYRRTVSCSDDGKQPNEENLYVLTFCTGPYIFGEDYNVDIFDEFFNELKTFNPKYSDTHNNKLYFTLENAKAVHNAYNDIFKKYQRKYLEYLKRNKIAALEKELESLIR